MYFNRKNAEQKNWRMIKKGKHFLFGCSLVFAVGASLATQTVHAETASESTVESGSKAKEAKPGYGGETGTYEAPAAVAETQPATVEKAVVAENTTAKTANKEALTQLVEEVKGLDKAGKTEDSLSRLNTALEQAQEVLANAEASQDQVDAALASLKEAVAQLVSKEEKATAVATEAKAEEATEVATETVAPAEPVRSRGKRDLSSRAAYRSVDGSVAEGEFAGAGVKQFQSVRYSVDGDRTTWTISVVPQHKNHQAAGLVVASDDTIQSITVVDRGPNAGRLNEDYYVEKDFGKLPAMSNHKALASHYKYIGGGVPDSLTYSVVTKGTHHNLFARFATAIVKNSLENGGMNGSSAVKNRTSDFPEVGINLSSRLAPQPGVNNTYTQTNDTITVPTVASTDTTISGTGKPGAIINLKSKGQTAKQTQVAPNGQWSFPLDFGLNSSVSGGPQLVTGDDISVTQTVNGQESAATPVNISLGHSEIVPSSKSKQQNNLVANDRNVTLKVPHDAGAAYFQFTDADGNAREVGLKRDAVPGKWQVNSSSSALASVASSEDGKFYSTINLTLNKDMKAGTTARVISNMQEGSYSSLQGWQSRNVEEAPKEETPKEETPAPVAPQPEPSKPNTPAVDSATTAPASAPEIVNNLAGKASTPADVTVKAPAGSTVKLYNKDGVVIGEAVANDQGVATVHPTNSLPEGEITATTTPAGGTESAKSAPITVTKTPLTEGKVSQQSNGSLVLIVSKNLVTVYPGDKIDIDVWADGTPSLEKFDAYQNPTGVAGVFPQGHFFATAGSNTWRNKKNKYIGTVAETQKAGTVDVGFVARNKKGNQFTDVIRVVVLETAKKYEPVAGTKVDVADPNNVSEDEKTKIIDSVKTANPSLPANATYSVDDKGNLTITYPDKSTDKISAAYLVNAVDKTAPDKPVVNTDLTGKAGTKTPVEVTAEKGSTVALYDKNNNKIGEATAGANGKATITPKVDIPAGPVTAKATDAAGNESKPSDPKEATPARVNVAPTVEIPYSDPKPSLKEVYLYNGEEADVDITFNDDSGKIKSAALKRGGNQALNNIDGNPDKQDNEFGYTVTAINSETATPAKIKVTGQVSGIAADKLPKTASDSLKLVTRFATATDTDGAFIVNDANRKEDPKTKEAVGSYLTDPGAVTFVLKAQTKKYDIKTPASADKVTVSDANNVTDKEFEKIKEKVKLEYSQNNPDARLADKKGKEVEDASKVVDKVEKEGNKVVVTYKDGSKDTKPLSEFVNVAPKVELPYSNEAKKEIYVYTGENTDLTFKASDNTAVKDMYVRGPGGIGKDNTADYGFTTGKIENSAVTHGDGTVSGATATIKMTGVTTLKAPNHWTSFVVANDNDNAPSNTDFNALDKNPNATQTPGYVHFIVKSQTDKYDIATPAPADKVEVADPTNVTKDDLDKIKEKLQLKYNKNNDDANIAKDTPVDKNGKIQSVKKDDKGNLVVTYTDGSTDKEPLSKFVTKKPTDADKNEPKAKDQTVKVGEEPKAEDSIENFKGLPEGTTAKFKEPVDTKTPGDKTPTVVVTYPDGSTEEVPVKVTVEKPSSEPTDADKNEPKAKDQTVKVGEEPKAEDSIENFKGLPEGTTAKFKEPVDTKTPGDKTPTVVVTYPDGSTEEVPVKVTVEKPSSEPTDADKNEPKAKDQTVKVGEEPKAEDSIENFKGLPEGTTAKFKEPVDTKTPGDKTPTVVVTYPDGSTEEVPVKVTVEKPSSEPTDADKNEPKAKDQTVKVGEEPKAEDSIENFKGLPEGTTAKFKEPVDTKTPGDKTPTVVVTYPDGSTEEVPVKVTVEKPSSEPTDADKNEPKAKDQTVKVGEEPKAEDSIENFKGLPEGTTAKFKEPVDTKTPGDKTPTVVVTYPDGSTEEVPVKVTVEKPSSEPTDADKNEPKAKDQTVKVGEEPKAEDSIENFKGLPEGTTAKFKEPVDTKTPGDKTPTVVVTYPDGSTEEVPVKVTVAKPSSEPTDADKNEPKAKDQTVKVGEEPKAEDSIENFKGLPEGTTAKFKEPVDTKTPGDKTPTVVVTYPDGSTEEVPVKVTVEKPSSEPTDADKNEPKAKDQTVKVGEEPKAEDSIENFKGLPEGTTAKFKEPVDTKTPGDKTPTVVVTYPDGSTEEVPVKVTVAKPSSEPTDADKNEPKAKDQTVKVGEEPKAEDSIENFKGLPEGTTAKFKEPVDTKTPGDKTPTVVVTYPDGSTEEVPVKVTVAKPSSEPTDADKNEPKAKDQTVKVGEEPKAEDSIENFKGLPEGTTAKFKEPVDTKTPGDKTPTVVVTYPDGSTEEVPVKVTVEKPSSPEDPSTKDTDGDGLTDKEEAEKGTDPKKADTDGDGLTDKEEVDKGTDPKKADTDGDGLTDKEEVDKGTDPKKADTDGDGLTDKEEAEKGTDPKKADTDGDGFTDKEEVDKGTDPKDPNSKPESKPEDPSTKDTDGDGLTDKEEAEKGTDPKKADTDGDGFTDKEEVDKGTDPKDPNSKPESKPEDPSTKDTDGDGLTDKEEAEKGTDPKKADTDGDGLTDKEEVDKGTDPKKADTDGDGLTDKEEVDKGTDPKKADTDGDGLTDKEEAEKGTDPKKADTDGDGFTDKEEVDKGTDPKDPNSKPESKPEDPSTKDTDGDGLTDKEEAEKGTDPKKADTDGDGFTDKEEVDKGTDPKDPNSKPESKPEDPSTKDTDGDGLTDKEEVEKGTDPTKADTDGDGLTDKEEAEKGTDPKKADTDGDGFTDKEEVDKGTDPKDPNSKPESKPEDPSTKDTDADKNTPVAKDQTVKPGDKPSAKDSIGNVGDLPKGTTVEFKTPVDTTTPGDKTPTVVVTYPDGSKDEVPVKVTVKDPSAPATDADKNTPTPKNQTVKPGDKPSAKDSIGNVGDLPKGTTVEFKTPVDTTTPGDKTPTVVVTYPDGSKDEVPVKVTVKDPSAPATDADKNTPTAKDQTVKPGDKPSAKDSIGNVGDLPKGTTVEFKTPVDTTTPGDKTPTVVVTYPDGSKDEVPVKVTVKDPSAPATDADKNTPTAKDQTVKPGDKPSAKDSIGNVGDLPKGTTVEFKTPVDTTTPGDKGTTVVVTYPDGSKDEVPVKVIVKDPSAPATDADKNTPVAKDQTVKPGDKPSAKDSIGNVGDLPKGTTVEFKTPVDTTTPGDKGTTVVVTYPDGSKDEVPVKVTVKDPSAPATDADKNTPVAKDQTVKPGDKPSAKDSIGNVGDLPKGTTVEFKTPVDTTTPGDKGTTVVVTYPDGSKDEVPVKVTVKDPSAPATDADKNTPTAKDQTVKPGDKPSAKDSIGNVGDLPKGTTVEFKTPVDTTTPGDKGTTVVVTYPDGSKDEVPVKVTVKDPSAPATDADKNTPVAKDQTVKPGDKPSAKDSIGNVGDLPKGTTVEFKTPVDTTTPGDKGTTVVVTYPDGSKDEVPVKVTVKDPTNKVVKDPAVTPVTDPSNLTDAEKAKVADEVKKANPTAKDIKVNKDGSVVVTFEDGTTAVIPADKTVKKSSDKVKESDGVKNPSVTPVTDPSNLTDAEKAKVADEVKKANPTAKDIKVNKDGSVVVTFEDGSVAVIPAEKAVTAANQDSPAQAPAKKAGAKELPNTGTEQSSASLALALLAAATGGLLFAKKREEEE